MRRLELRTVRRCRRETGLDGSDRDHGRGKEPEDAKDLRSRDHGRHAPAEGGAVGEDLTRPG